MNNREIWLIGEDLKSLPFETIHRKDHFSHWSSVDEAVEKLASHEPTIILVSKQLDEANYLAIKKLSSLLSPHTLVVSTLNENLKKSLNEANAELYTKTYRIKDNQFPFSHL